MLPRKREGRIALALLLIAYLAFAPPFVSVANVPDLVAGIPTLYLWTLFWGLVMMVVLVWAARVDAWGISQDQVPPEIRDRTATIGFRDTDRDESSQAGGDD